MTESTISAPRRGVPIWAQIIIWVFLAGLLLIVAMGLSRAQQGTVQPGQVIDNFSLPLYSGYELDGNSATSIEELRGKVIVINFWASWCAECRIEQDALQTTWNRFRDSGVTVLGVNFQDTAPDAREYVGSLGISYPIVQDTESATALAYGLRGVPETFVVDRAGRISDRIIGPVSLQRLADLVNAQLQAGAR